MGRDRTALARLADETLDIIEAGQYTVDGRLVALRAAIDRAVTGTRSYPPGESLPSESPPGERPPARAGDGGPGATTVTGETTLAAAQRLARQGHRVVALNFASARKPGGGFRSGAVAQEESLARASALYPCLAGNPMYGLHNAKPDPMYTDYAIYSPDVPVFRDDGGALLTEPYACSFITAPAVNAGVLAERRDPRTAEVAGVMRARIDKVLAIAAAYDHDAVVLGAWGCGVFRNDPRVIATAFAEALADSPPPQAVFAVYDPKPPARTLALFREILTGGTP